MKFQPLLFVAVLIVSDFAIGDIVTKIEAVEVTASNISFPSTPNGQLLFRPCAGECEEQYKIVRLTPESEFVVGGLRMKFSEFRQQFYGLVNRNEAYALVSFDTDQKTVTSIRLGT